MLWVAPLLWFQVGVCECVDACVLCGVLEEANLRFTYTFFPTQARKAAPLTSAVCAPVLGRQRAATAHRTVVMCLVAQRHPRKVGALSNSHSHKDTHSHSL